MPQFSGDDCARILSQLHFHLKSQKGSHMKFERASSLGREIIVIPRHKVIKKGTLHGILKKLHLTIDELKRMV
ncbi:MAG: type II toxin-antitoxin system HicA family toxin [Parcubacteria group bacterium]|nr:type II toxin-antitoxin system HicA family toxin [Parcubacteria group bacterium]